jgi:hypothetical protein
MLSMLNCSQGQLRGHSEHYKVKEEQTTDIFNQNINTKESPLLASRQLTQIQRRKGDQNIIPRSWKRDNFMKLKTKRRSLAKQRKRKLLTDSLENENLVEDNLSVTEVRLKQVMEFMTPTQLEQIFHPQSVQEEHVATLNETQSLDPLLTEREILPDRRAIEGSASPIVNNHPTSPPTSAPTSAPTKSPTSSQGPGSINNDHLQTGPWAECIGWEASDCKNYLETMVLDKPRVVLVYSNLNTFERNRVRVYTSIEGIVVRRPERG